MRFFFVFISVCVFNVWLKTTLLLGWPRDTKRLYTPAYSFLLLLLLAETLILDCLSPELYNTLPLFWATQSVVLGPAALGNECTTWLVFSLYVLCQVMSSDLLMLFSSSTMSHPHLSLLTLIPRPRKHPGTPPLSMYPSGRIKWSFICAHIEIGLYLYSSIVLPCAIVFHHFTPNEHHKYMLGMERA